MDGKQYQKKSVLQRLYVGCGMSDREIAEKYDVSRTLIGHWRRRHGIEGRSMEEYAALRPATFETSEQGYEWWRADTSDDVLRVYVHRLLAVSEHGFDEVTSSDIHHKNGIRWDNRPDNIDVKGVSEHRRHHSEQDRERNESGQYI
ncbi:HNH endonuclease [Natrinema sp. DC36]|uniref:HNH endonuclease n=1 Tax=Natrinema sp. DC36 TaxID=2878680 RepID=UPI001CF03EBE|nr:HNH endonuclease [Natrinema sp. DC36]